MYQRLGDLSAKYESSGNPGSVGINEGDSGGWSYGIYQLASNTGATTSFVEWMCLNEDPQVRAWGNVLASSGDPRSDEMFVDAWRNIASGNEQLFGDVQDAYASMAYYQPGAEYLMEEYGFDISNRSLALKQVLFSNCVQHGYVYGSEVFKEASDLAGIPLDQIDDATLIYYIYEVKLTDMSWSSGAPECRPGLFNRWKNERTMALSLLPGGDRA